jgi:hypothetical protein
LKSPNSRSVTDFSSYLPVQGHGSSVSAWQKDGQRAMIKITKRHIAASVTFNLQETFFIKTSQLVELRDHFLEAIAWRLYINALHPA